MSAYQFNTSPMTKLRACSINSQTQRDQETKWMEQIDRLTTTTYNNQKDSTPNTLSSLTTTTYQLLSKPTKMVSTRCPSRAYTCTSLTSPRLAFTRSLTIGTSRPSSEEVKSEWLPSPNPKALSTMPDGWESPCRPRARDRPDRTVVVDVSFGVV